MKLSAVLFIYYYVMNKDDYRPNALKLAYGNPGKTPNCFPLCKVTN